MVLISFVIPFYHGNQYIKELINCLSQINQLIMDKTGKSIELILVNDSPEIEVKYDEKADFSVEILNNPCNLGIQASRINGLQSACGEWINFLDQDDLLFPEKYESYLKYMDQADVIISNGYYERDGEKQRIYRNIRIQNYYIQKEQLIRIRNLIPSPGESLIRKDCIPIVWKENVLDINGADDWMLWLLLHTAHARFISNPEILYIHRATDQGNLSNNYEKMYESCQNMLSVLKRDSNFDKYDLSVLGRAIKFKYLKDTGRINATDYLKYCDCVFANIIYKFVEASGMIVGR